MTQQFDDSATNITTARLTLRVLREDDVEAIWPYVSDPEISRYMAWLPHDSRDTTRSFIRDVRVRMLEGQTIAWIVERRSRVCGLVSLIGIARTHRALRYDKAELAYWLGKEFRSEGIGTEACDAVLRYGFQEMQLNKVTLGHVACNEPSQRLVERLGFRLIGTEYHHFSKSGVWFDILIYEMLATDWQRKLSDR